MQLQAMTQENQDYLEGLESKCLAVGFHGTPAKQFVIVPQRRMSSQTGHVCAAALAMSTKGVCLQRHLSMPHPAVVCECAPVSLLQLLVQACLDVHVYHVGQHGWAFVHSAVALPELEHRMIVYGALGGK